MPNLLRLLFKRRSLNLSELCSFTRNLAAILTPTLPIAGAIDLISKQAFGGRAAEALSIIAADIQSGNTLSQAFQKHEMLFGTFFCSIIAQEEGSGNPNVVFLKLSEYYENKCSFRKKITCLLKYPLIILLGTIGIYVTLLLFFIPPGLQKVLNNPENLPFATKITVSIAVFVQIHASGIAMLSVFILVLFFWLWHSNLKSPWLSSLAWNIPVIGDVLRKNSLQRFSLALSTLLSCGFDLSHALATSASELRNVFLEKRILHALIDTINNSESIFNILKELSIFPPFIIEMAKNEKRSNHSNEQLKKISTFYQDEVEAAFNAFTIIIGPVFVAVIGLLGLGVLISLYLPVFKVVGNP
jgi:type IV pilus assembly protein PilC